jgi:membrane-associated phospholipid phosphatase
MQGQRQLDDAEVGSEMAAVDGADLDEGGPDFLGEGVDVGTTQVGEIGRRSQTFEHGPLFDAANAKPVHLAPGTLPPPARLRIRDRVWKDVARIFSTVCNPFLTSLLLFVILAGARSRTNTDFWVLLGNSAFFTSFGPMLYVFWLYATDRISDLDMSNREERERVFVVFVIFFALGTVDLWLIGAPAIITASMAAYAVSSLVVQWITRYWKISTHALGITAPLIALCVLYGTRPLPFLILIPIVCWARVYLRAHTVLQVIAGVGLASVSTVVVFRLFHVI